MPVSGYGRIVNPNRHARYKIGARGINHILSEHLLVIRDIYGKAGAGAENPADLPSGKPAGEVRGRGA